MDGLPTPRPDDAMTARATSIPEVDLARIRRTIDVRIPARAAAQVRLELEVGGTEVTIVERFDAEEAARRSAHLELDLLVPNARVVVVDGDAYYSRPGPRLANGVRQLGHLLHPDAVPNPGLPLIELMRVPIAAS